MHKSHSESHLNSCIREAASIGEEMKGIQLFPKIEQRDMQGNFQRIHTPLSFKLLKEIKTA